METIAEHNCTHEEALAPVRAGLEEVRQNMTDTRNEVTRLKTAGDATVTGAFPGQGREEAHN